MLVGSAQGRGARKAEAPTAQGPLGRGCCNKPAGRPDIQVYRVLPKAGSPRIASYPTHPSLFVQAESGSPLDKRAASIERLKINPSLTKQMSASDGFFKATAKVLKYLQRSLIPSCVAWLYQHITDS